MIRYGLKLWSSNLDLFAAARAEYERGAFDFIEIYNDPSHPLDFGSLSTLKGVLVTVHATHSRGFHEFIMGVEQLRIWNDVVALANFFDAQYIVVHPGREHTIETFKENLLRIDDPRILIENMAALTVEEYPTFASSLSDLEKIRVIKPICFDFEKAVKAACYLKIPYKEYSSDAVRLLQPSYFHISGGDPSNALDEHGDLESSSIDFAWIKKLLLTLPYDSLLVFETPKRSGIENDLKNMAYFRSL